MVSLNKMPDLKINQYKIVLLPHEDLAKKILSLKEEFQNEFHVENTFNSYPQLILGSFRQLDLAEERIKNRLRIVAMGHHPVKIELQNFGSFPSHTIYLNVTSRVPVTELVKKIRKDTQRLMKLDADNKPHFMNDAHLTIARKLKPWQYEKAWLEYSQKHFSGKFIATKMILLRKAPGEVKFKVIERFDFQNLPVETKQGQLF